MITFKQRSKDHKNNESEETRDALGEVLISVNRRTSSAKQQNNFIIYKEKIDTTTKEMI